MEKRLTTPKEKALRINLDAALYGSFAEIGAGQDVAAHFFKAGGASGTVAKTMSAYDMTFSDAIYGPEESGRYVCEPRLVRMLDKEFGLCIKRLQHRADNTCFFAFADTVEALNFKRTNQGQGWAGIRFQLTPQSEPNECVIHVRLHDNDPVLQQQAMGIIGVNLIYGCFYLHQDPEQLLMSLMDELSPVRVEVDYFRLKGPNFKRVDHRLFSLKLVSKGLTNAALFSPDGSVLQPADALYKKNILVLRGRFRPVTHVNMDMLEKGYIQFCEEPDVAQDNIFTLCELTLADLFDPTKGDIDEKDFLARVDLLCSLGLNVLISNYTEYFRLAEYLCKFTRKRKIAMIVGVYNLAKIFDEKFYDFLPGGILQSFGSLFGHNIKLYVYPSFRKGSQEIIGSAQIDLHPQLAHLYQYLVTSDKIEDLVDGKTENLHIISDEVLKMIREDAAGWEELVPTQVAEAIKAKCLFDYPCDPAYRSALLAAEDPSDFPQN